ncbi:MAG: hypothetical protein AMXMBFR82_53210 [Candidatus Hydrogenedentota bacterium]
MYHGKDLCAHQSLPILTLNATRPQAVTLAKENFQKSGYMQREAQSPVPTGLWAFSPRLHGGVEPRETETCYLGYACQKVTGLARRACGLNPFGVVDVGIP